MKAKLHLEVATNCGIYIKKWQQRPKREWDYVFLDPIQIPDGFLTTSHHTGNILPLSRHKY